MRLALQEAERLLAFLNDLFACASASFAERHDVAVWIAPRWVQIVDGLAQGNHRPRMAILQQVVRFQCGPSAAIPSPVCPTSSLNRYVSGVALAPLPLSSSCLCGCPLDARQKAGVAKIDGVGASFVTFTRWSNGWSSFHLLPCVSPVSVRCPGFPGSHFAAPLVPTPFCPEKKECWINELAVQALFGNRKPVVTIKGDIGQD